ncbi:hypothetical protein NP493_332g03017 [Ridgeia piscesae]|uniref:Uncharacterized protein n=1 Tax=Ridgeia piscesae TaxID=27915 RepID=A0AAD9NVS6_RIDPI|nr:hypothetical protein NP493_332g03017 [Ridgeia piscesae]
MEALANPFEEESAGLFVLDRKKIADPSTVDAVKKEHKIGQQQFQTFTKECLVDRTKPMMMKPAAAKTFDEYAQQSKVLLLVFCKKDKEIVLTDGKGVFSPLLLHDVHTPAPCSHEEPDSRILHISHAAMHGHHQMLIPTVDPDVVVLAMFAINHLPAGCELWIAFGTGKSFRYLAAYQIVASLGPEMSCALSMFHATMYPALLDMERRQHGQPGSHCRN